MSKQTDKKGGSKGTVINRLTSETLRLADVENGSLQRAPRRKASVLPDSTRSKKSVQNSSSSFQVTGVTKNETSEDSADDMDESHTDDISRITDTETPSFSEDSKDADDHLIEPQTIIRRPNDDTNEQIKGTIKNGVDHPAPIEEEAQDVTESSESVVERTVDAPVTTVVSPKPPRKNDQQLLPRFKVVKISSTVQQNPCMRGRWVCSDSYDNATSTFKHQLPKETAILTTPKDTPPQFRTPLPPVSPLTPLHFGIPRRPIGPPQHDMAMEIRASLTAKQIASTSQCSAPNTNSIDRKIEEALDTVKSHLTVAVRREVNFLRTRVNKLEGRVTELEVENTKLKFKLLVDRISK